MHAGLRFSQEMIDGDRFGKLVVPYAQIAHWINFLASPHYGAHVVFAEQNPYGVEIYFQGCEGLYSYLERRVNADPRGDAAEILPAMALAS